MLRSLLSTFFFCTICLPAWAQPPGGPSEGTATDLLAAGQAAFSRKDFSLAVRSLQSLCARYKDSNECRQGKLTLGTAHFLTSQYAEAAAVLESLPCPQSRAAEVLHMLSSSYIYLGRIDDAQRALGSLYDLPPDSPEARLLTARMMVRLERETEALQALSELAGRTPPLPSANYFLGILHLGRSEFDQAITAFRREIRYNPTLSDAQYKLGDALGRKQKWIEAIPHLQMSIWLNPDQSGPYVILGKAYLNTENLQNAEAMLRRALEIDPNNSAAAYSLAQALRRAGRASEATVLFERVRKQSQ